LEKVVADNFHYYFKLQPLFNQ